MKRNERQHKVSDSAGKLGFFQQLASALARRLLLLFLQSPAHSSHTPASAEKRSEARQASLLPTGPDSFLEGCGKYWAPVEEKHYVVGVRKESMRMTQTKIAKLRPHRCLSLILLQPQ